MKKFFAVIIAAATLCVLSSSPVPVVKGQSGEGKFHRARNRVPN